MCHLADVYVRAFSELVKVSAAASVVSAMLVEDNLLHLSALHVNRDMFPIVIMLPEFQETPVLLPIPQPIRIHGISLAFRHLVVTRRRPAERLSAFVIIRLFRPVGEAVRGPFLVELINWCILEMRRHCLYGGDKK